MRSEIITRPIVGSEDIYNSASVAANAGDGATTAPVTIASKQLKYGRKAFIRSLGNAVQSGGTNVVTFRLLVNGQRLYPYDGSQNQWGDPALMQDLPARIEVPGGAVVAVQCDNSDGANAWVATARVWVEYEDL